MAKMSRGTTGITDWLETDKGEGVAANKYGATVCYLKQAKMPNLLPKNISI